MTYHILYILVLWLLEQFHLFILRYIGISIWDLGRRFWCLLKVLCLAFAHSTIGVLA